MSFEPSGQHCPLCHGTTLQTFSAMAADCPQNSQISVIECAPCGFAWQWPLVRSTDESRAYFANSYANAEQGTYFDKEQKKEICDLQMKYLESLTRSKGRLLDIGSGDGSFCEFAHQFGWTAYGIDPAGPNKQEKSETGELRLINGSLSSLQTNQKFDVITMWDVVEHLENPLEIIDTCKKHLSHNGWLVLETGNFQSVDRVNSGNDWWCYQKDHRWYFAPEAMSEALKTIGFGKFAFSERALRPWLNFKGKFRGPSRLDYFMRSIKRPWLISANIAEFRKLTDLSHKFSDVAHIPIFTMAAQVSP